MAQHDCRGHRRFAGPQGHDLALAGLGQRRRGAADEAASPSCWLSAVPRWPFQPLASSIRNVSTAAGDFGRRPRHVELDSTMFGEAIALTAQFFQFLRAQRLAQHLVGVASGVKAGADMRLQHHGLHAAAMQHVGKGLHRRAIERDGAEDQRMRAGPSGLLQNGRDGFLRPFAIEQRRAERAVGIGADQSGQRDFVGAPHRDHGHQADQAWKRRATRRARRRRRGPAPKRSPPIPIRANNSRSARRRVRTARAIGSRKRRRAASAPRRSLAQCAASLLDARRTVDVSAISATSPNPRSRFM